MKYNIAIGTGWQKTRHRDPSLALWAGSDDIRRAVRLNQ